MPIKHLFSQNHIIPHDNRTKIEPEQKQKDRKCPVFKAFQSLNVLIFLLKLQTDSTEYKAKSLILSHFGAI